MPRPIQKTAGIARRDYRTRRRAGFGDLRRQTPTSMDEHRRHEQETDPRGDDLRRLDDLHRPDDRRDRVPSLQDDLSLSSTGVQWIINGYLLSLSALFAFGGRLADIAGHRTMVVIGVDRLRHRLGALRRHPDRLARRGLADHLPRDPGRRRGDHVPGGAGDRPRRLPGARARPRAGDLLRDRRRPHLDRPARRRLPGRVDLAGDLLGQHPGRDHRPRPHRESEAGRRASTRRRSTTAAPCWSPAAWAWPCSACSSRASGAGAAPTTWVCIAAGLALLAAFVLYELRVDNPLLRLRIFADRAFAVDNVDPLPADDPLRAAVLLRQHVRADLARRKRLGNRPLPADLLRRLRHRLAVRRQDPRPGRRAAGGGARLRGRRGRLLPLGQLAARPLGQRPVVLHRPRRGRGRPGPQPGQHRRAQPGAARAATARRPGSPRRCATSAPASASPCSARS